MKLFVYTEKDNLPWLQYILDEFCRIERAIFSIKVKCYNDQPERDSESLYYLKGNKSDVFQSTKNDLSLPYNLKIIDFKEFQILDGTLGHSNYWMEYDLFWNAFFYLSRLHEFQLSQQGVQTKSYSFRTKMPKNFNWKIPHVNFLFKEFKSQIKLRLPEFKFKKDEKAILELSHDLDYIEKTPVLILKQTAFNGFNFLKSPDLKSLSKAIKFIFSKSNYWNFDYWQDVENEYQLKSIFYVYSKVKTGLKQTILDPSYDVTKNKKLIDKLLEIQKEGWQIGLHGSFYSYNDFDLLEAEKNQLEQQLQFEITKNRQHWLNYHEMSTPELHQKLFEVDSTLGWNDSIGFRASVASKYRPFNHVENKPFQYYIIPQAVMDSNIYDYGYGKEREKILDGIEIINTCKKLKNTEFSISWHSRTSSKDYNWSPGYVELIKIFSKAKL
jgi:hypothetical protein